METLVRRVASEKPESVTLPGSSWRSEIGYAEISHIEDNIVPFVCRVNSRGQAGVLVTGLEPTRACAQRCERSLRLPVSPHQHLVGYDPGNPEGQDARPHTRCRPRGHNTSRPARVWYREHASRTTSPRYGPRAQARGSRRVRNLWGRWITRTAVRARALSPGIHSEWAPRPGPSRGAAVQAA